MSNCFDSNWNCYGPCAGNSGWNSFDCCCQGPPGPRGATGPAGVCALPAAGCLSGDGQIIVLPAGNIERRVELPDAVFPAQNMRYETSALRIDRTGYYTVSYYVQGQTNPAAVWYAYGKLNGVFTPLLDDRNYTPVTGNVTLRGESVMYLREGDTLSLYVNADTATTLTIRNIGGAQLLAIKLPLRP